MKPKSLAQTREWKRLSSRLAAANKDPAFVRAAHEFVRRSISHPAPVVKGKKWPALKYPVGITSPVAPAKGFTAKERAAFLKAVKARQQDPEYLRAAHEFISHQTS
jgi:hypothetical protein